MDDFKKVWTYLKECAVCGWHTTVYDKPPHDTKTLFVDKRCPKCGKERMTWQRRG